MRMAKTFGYRRQEIIQGEPSIKEIMEQWPALFQDDEVNAEYLRITTHPLESTFYAQLDKHASKLIQVARRRGGPVGMKAAGILAEFDEASLDDSLDASGRRKCALKLLMVLLGDPVDEIIKERQDQEDFDVEEEIMSVVVTSTVVKIVFEGEEVMSALDSVVQAFAMLFGLIYSLNLQYPKKCAHTFEFIQKVIMGLDAKKMSGKVHNLCVLLHSE